MLQNVWVDVFELRLFFDHPYLLNSVQLEHFLRLMSHHKILFDTQFSSIAGTQKRATFVITYVYIY